MHVGVPGRVPGVDAASCKSVGYTGGTGDIFTNCHLLVFACGYLRYHVLFCYVIPVTLENIELTSYLR